MAPLMTNLAFIEMFKNKIKRGIHIDDGGWHFSYLGGVKNIKLKLGSFAHRENKYPSKGHSTVIQIHGSTGRAVMYNHKEKQGL